MIRRQAGSRSGPWVSPEDLHQAATLFRSLVDDFVANAEEPVKARTDREVLTARGPRKP